MRLRWRNRRKSKQTAVSDRMIAYRPGADVAQLFPHPATALHPSDH